MALRYLINNGETISLGAQAQRVSSATTWYEGDLDLPLKAQ